MAMTITLPTALVEELKIWKMAFTASYGKEVSYGEMIRGMLDSLEVTEPGVVKELERIVEKDTELMNVIRQIQERRMGKRIIKVYRYVN